MFAQDTAGAATDMAMDVGKDNVGDIAGSNAGAWVAPRPSWFLPLGGSATVTAREKPADAATDKAADALKVATH